MRVRFLVQDLRIRPDLGAKVTFLQSRATSEIVTLKRVIRIPASALKGGAAWVVRDGRATPVPVTVGERSGDAVEILSGLNEGDQVIVSPGRLRKGMRVRIVSDANP